jgi:hypothetical protein
MAGFSPIATIIVNSPSNYMQPIKAKQDAILVKIRHHQQTWSLYEAQNVRI